jgi:nucleolin
MGISRQDQPDDKWTDAVLSVVRGATDKLKVKKLRKLVLLSLQLDDDDKESKKTFKATIQTLEKAGDLDLDAEGLVTLTKKRKKAEHGEKKEKKKSKKSSAPDEISTTDDLVEKRSKRRTQSDGDAEDEHDSKANEGDVAVVAKIVKKSKPCPGNPQGVTRLFLGNLPFAVDETTLSDFLPGLSHIKWITDKETGKFYGSAFVEAESPVAAADAVAKGGQSFMGRPIKVNYAPAREGDVWPPPKKVVSGNQTSASATTGGQAGGKGIQAMSAKPDGCTKLFIGNLSYEIDDDGITKFFAAVDAEVKAVRWIHHKDSGDFKGVGFVEFWNTQACEKAAALNGKDLLGRPIRIDWTD